MKTPVYTGAFHRDVKRCRKRGDDFERFKAVVSLLLAGKPLPRQYRPHRLGGKYSNYWECHLAPDWLLIFSEDDERVCFCRMGSHTDLF